jgi:hypothetical protein
VYRSGTVLSYARVRIDETRRNKGLLVFLLKELCCQILRRRQFLAPFLKQSEEGKKRFLKSHGNTPMSHVASSI